MRTEIYYDEFDLPIDMSKKILIQIFTTRINIEERVKPMIQEIKSRMPNAAIIGSSAIKTIDNGKVRKESCIIGVTYMESSFAETAIVEKNDKFVKSIKTTTNSLLRKRKSRQAAIAFGTTFVNGDEILSALAQSDDEMIVVGGLAEPFMNNENNEPTSYVFTEDGLVEDGLAIAILFGNKLNINTEMDLSWIPLGHVFTVTKSIGNKVYELDNIPIKILYEQYFGKELVQAFERDINLALNYPLLIINENYKTPIARAIILIDEEYFTFAGNVLEGEQVSFGFGDLSVDLNANNIVHDFNAESIFIYSCCARFKLIGDAIEKEMHTLARKATTVGLYTYGEFYKNESSKNDFTGRNCFLNQSITILELNEESTTNKDISIPYTKEQDNESRDAGIKRRAMNNFVKAVTQDLSESVKIQKKLSMEETKLKKFIKSQLSKKNVGDMMKILSEQVLDHIHTINQSVSDISFKNDVGEVKTEDIKIMKGLVDVSISKIHKVLISLSDTVIHDNKIVYFSIQEVFSAIYTIFTTRLDKKKISLVPVFIENEHNKNYMIMSKKFILQEVLLLLMKDSIEMFRQENELDRKIILSVKSLENKMDIEIICNMKNEFFNILQEIFLNGLIADDENYAKNIEIYLIKMVIEEELNGKIWTTNNQQDGMKIHLEIPHLNDKK